MIYLITGTPGASKTLNTLKLVCESDTFKGREIYYFNISELQLPWTQLGEDEIKRWFDLPHGAVIVVDEAQGIFPQRPPTRTAPEHVERLAQHRHSGYDFVLVTQNPKMLDSTVRYLVERHIHFERQFGLESAKQLSWEKCVDDPNNESRKSLAVVKRVAFDKKYYGLYKSAEVHTVKKQIPFKVFAPFILLAVVIVVGYWRFQERYGTKPAPVAVAPAPHQSSTVLTSQPKQDREPVKTLQDYVDERTPRLHDVPSSAPIYDKLTVVKSFPRPQCLMFKTSGKCNCFTQQATPLDISYAACVNYVKNGYFDATKSDDSATVKTSSPSGAQQADEQAAQPLPSA